MILIIKLQRNWRAYQKMGVKKFIFISSQSIYGISKENQFLDEYKSKKIQLQHMQIKNDV